MPPPKYALLHVKVQVSLSPVMLHAGAFEPVGTTRRSGQVAEKVVHANTDKGRQREKLNHPWSQLVVG